MHASHFQKEAGRGHCLRAILGVKRCQHKLVRRKYVLVRKNGVGTGHSLDRGIFLLLCSMQIRAERGLMDRRPGKLKESRQKLNEGAHKTLPAEWPVWSGCLDSVHFAGKKIKSSSSSLGRGWHSQEQPSQSS